MLNVEINLMFCSVLFFCVNTLYNTMLRFVCVLVDNVFYVSTLQTML